jgi:hypothetical protein
MALAVRAAVGHSVRGAANGRQYWSVGPGPDAVARSGSADLPPAPHSSLTPPLPQTFGFQPLRSASEVCFLNLVRLFS